jgi:hypothetical protein
MAIQPQQLRVEPQQQLPVEYIDRPELAETFADWTSAVVFDGQMLRIELCATRLDHAQPAAALRARRVPVCRLALPPAMAIDFFNRLQQTISALVQRGIVRQSTPGGPTSQEMGQRAETKQ